MSKHPPSGYMSVATLGPMSTPAPTSAPLPTRHSLTILAVRDVARSLHFYRKSFGWPQTVDVPVYVQFTLVEGRSVGLYQQDAFAANTGITPTLPPEGQISGAELYLEVDDLEGAVTRVTGAGGRLLSPAAPRPWGDEVAYFADPDGHVLALAQVDEAHQ